MHYLTVQDVLWINSEIARCVNSYKYAQLEECVSYQYGYGKSEDALQQAGTFLRGILKLRPFASHNQATALISALVFLKINGYDVEIGDASIESILESISLNKLSATEALDKLAKKSDVPLPLKPAIRTEVHDMMEQCANGLEALPA